MPKINENNYSGNNLVKPPKILSPKLWINSEIEFGNNGMICNSFFVNSSFIWVTLIYWGPGKKFMEPEKKKFSINIHHLH